MRRTLVWLLIGLYSAVVPAGHGLMTTFNDVEPLPDAGLTPLQFSYRLDLLDEQTRLLLTPASADRYPLAIAFAREKLAEIEALVVQDHGSAAAPAVEAYRAYLDSAAAAVLESPAEQRDARAEHFANALLEQRYLMSTNYLDLPSDSRPVIGGVIEVAVTHYENLTAVLRKAFKKAQFFKEEEVRWAWETAQQADLQGL